MTEWLRIFWLPSKTVTELKELPRNAGIYYVTALWVVLYVGKTKNLRDRWKSSHHRYEQFKLLRPFGRLHYRVLPSDRISAYEKLEISRLQPAWNYTNRATFWSLFCLFVLVWGRAVFYLIVFLLVVAVLIYMIAN